jgi:hypothetical protein
MSIESEEKRQRITKTIERWAEHTKVKPYLRDYDIPGLVESIITEFYHVKLCCGHWVRELDEGIPLEIDDGDGKAYGDYCKDCAEKAIKEGWARKAPIPSMPTIWTS